MKCSIFGFPHAEFDVVKGYGHLVYYYPYTQSDEWRTKSYSPEILNYKEGTEESIKFFVEPFIKLADFAVQQCGQKGQVYLIPLPSSLAWNDPKISRSPRNKALPGNRNRDDRNAVFCNLVGAKDTRFQSAELIRRLVSKVDKVPMSQDEHAKMLEVTEGRLPKGSTLILVDDVWTKGGTSLGAKKKLMETYPDAKILILTLGLTKEPSSFEPLI